MTALPRSSEPTVHDQLVFTAPIPEGVVVRNGDVLRTEIEYTVENDGRMTLHSVSVIGIDRARSDHEDPQAVED